FVFILVLGISLGEGFGKKPFEGVRVSVLVEDQGFPRFFDTPAMVRDGFAWFTLAPSAAPGAAGVWRAGGATPLAQRNHAAVFPHQSWSQSGLDDLAQPADIAVELIPAREEAERLVSRGRRPAVLILGRNFSKRVARASFLATDDQPVTMLIPTLLSP